MQKHSALRSDRCIFYKPRNFILINGIFQIGLQVGLFFVIKENEQSRHMTECGCRFSVTIKRCEPQTTAWGIRPSISKTIGKCHPCTSFCLQSKARRELTWAIILLRKSSKKIHYTLREIRGHQSVSFMGSENWILQAHFFQNSKQFMIFSRRQIRSPQCKQ